MTSLASLVSSYTRTPSATCYLDGKRWRGIQKLRYSQRFGENIAGGGAEGRSPPVTPRIGMAISWRWGYNGYEVNGCTGEVSDVTDFSYPDRYALQVKDVLWRADKSSQVLVTDPLNDITARAAIIYILTHYGGLSASRLQIPTLNASGSAWGGSEWVLGRLTPVAWGDTENETGGTTAIKAAQEIASCLGYWIYATADGKVTAKLMERRPSASAREVFERNVNLLLQGAPERRANYDSIYNQVTVLGGNTGVEGSQIRDQFRTTHPLLPSGVYRDFSFSSFLVEYVNESEAGAASATKIAQRILNVISRIPDVIPLRAKADPNRRVGDTVGIIDTGIAIASQKNYFIYAIDRELDLAAGRFDDQLTLDGGTGSTGYTTIPPPDASFAWRLMAETLDGTPVVEVLLDGSASTSPTGEIVSYTWSTATPTYGSTPNTATGETAVLIFEASEGTATITLTVVDTTSKTGEFEAEVDLSGADTLPPIQEVISAAAGAAWLVTPDGGATWNEETTNGDATSVGIIGAGADDRSLGTGGTYGLLATRGSGGAGGLRQTLDTLATPSTNLVANAAAITSNIWVNESNPARIWFAIGDTPYRSTDGGATKTAMAKPAAGVDITWIMEDPALDDSVFCLVGADMYNATNPAVGWALLYEGPVGAAARQFVRSRDGQVTWICYTGAPSGEALQRVENGAAADVVATDVRTLSLDREASTLRATLYAITGDDPAEIWSFDGLTGLSAAQSGETFPSGATVQHMLASRQADLMYTADFDSVSAGQGALRKYFPQSDSLLLWKELASGQQGHMLGLGAAAQNPVTLYLLPWGGSGATDKIWKHTPTLGWAGLTPPQAGWYWFGILASAFDSDQLLLWGNSVTGNGVNAYTLDGVQVLDDGGTASPLYWSTDGGATWTPVALQTTKTRNDSALFVAWSDSVAGEFYAAMITDTTANEAFTVWRGSTTALSGINVTPGGNGRDLWGMCAGLGGDLILEGTPGNGDPQNFGYVPAGATSFGDVGGDINTDLFYLEPLPFPSPAVVCRAGSVSPGNDIYATPDYREGAPSNRITVAGGSLAAIADGVYVGDRTGVQKVTDLLGSPAAATEAATSGIAVGHIQAGRRQRESLAARVGSSVDVLVYSGGVWTTVAGPSATTSAALSNWVEIAD